MIDVIRGHAFSLTFVAVIFAYFFWESDDDASIYQLSGLTMGTSYSIQVAGFPENLDKSAVATAVADLLFKMDKEIFSTYSQSSELSALNGHPVNNPFAVSEHLFKVLKFSQLVSEETEGAFDVTVGPLVNLWGFGPTISTTDSVPDREDIERLRTEIGFSNLQLNEEEGVVVKKSEIEIDLSAIAKGYAVDQLALYFDELSVDSYFLEVGGELKIKGLKPGGQSWVPAMEAPIDSMSQIHRVFFNRGETIAVAGSGDYRNYFEQDGIRYSHEIDPRSGYPISHNLAATYVIHESAALADAYATAYMVLGYDSSMSLAESMGQAAYFIVKTDDDFEGVSSSAFLKYLEE